MRIKFLPICILLLLPVYTMAQVKKLICDELKNGIFYFYPQNCAKGFLILRKGTLQKEIDLSTKDTSLWEIKWQDPCTYTLNFIKSSLPKTKSQIEWLNNNLLVTNILTVTNQYYVFAFLAATIFLNPLLWTAFG